MSNSTILDRLEKQVQALEDGKTTVKDFVRFMDANTEALEGIPWSEVQKSRDIQFRIEISWTHDEDEDVPDLQAGIKEARAWIKELKHKICQPATAPYSEPAARSPQG